MPLDRLAPLRALQRRLVRLYDLPPTPDVASFLCSSERAEGLAPGQTRRGEVLLVHEVQDRVEVGLYLEPDALRALAGGPAGVPFGAYCLAAEGVSHFVYLAFRAAEGRSVRQLELEVQAEVDTYAMALVADQGAWTDRAGARVARSRQLRHRLFGHPVFHDAAHTEAGARYRAAHHVAGRYVAWLEARFVARGALAPFLGELRRFYRRGPTGKLRLPAL